MKKTNLFLVAWMMLGVAFTACSDDDEDGGKFHPQHHPSH